MSDKPRYFSDRAVLTSLTCSWVGATLVGETHDHRCRLIIAETGAEMQVRLRTCTPYYANYLPSSEKLTFCCCSSDGITYV